MPIFRIISKYKDISGKAIDGGVLVKFLFLLLSFLNILDAVFTSIGLHFQFIKEANPLMNSLWNISPFLFLFCKITLSVLLVFLAYFFLLEAKRRWYLFLSLPVLFYFGVLIIHIGWIMMVI